MRGFGAGTGDERGALETIRVDFDHLDALTDHRGLFEHARHGTPRVEHGYCVDDAARGLVVTCRERNPGPSCSDCITAT